MKKLKVLTKREIASCLKKHPAWILNAKETQFSSTFDFENHVAALVMIARITVHAEVQQHHPDIQYTYKKLKIKLTTHDVKGVTKKDVKLITKIDELVASNTQRA